MTKELDHKAGWLNTRDTCGKENLVCVQGPQEHTKFQLFS